MKICQTASSMCYCFTEFKDAYKDEWVKARFLQAAMLLDASSARRDCLIYTLLLVISTHIYIDVMQKVASQGAKARRATHLFYLKLYKRHEDDDFDIRALLIFALPTAPSSYWRYRRDAWRRRHCRLSFYQRRSKALPGDGHDKMRFLYFTHGRTLHPPRRLLATLTRPPSRKIILRVSPPMVDFAEHWISGCRRRESTRWAYVALLLSLVTKERRTGIFASAEKYEPQ